MGSSENKTDKKSLAMAFLDDLSKMSPERLQEVIRSVVGEELAMVMFNYARQVMEATPQKALENASSLIILGYLIRVHEEAKIPPENLPV